MNNRKIILSLFFLVLTINLLHAQPPPPPPQDIPLDGGFLWLLLAGIGLAYKKMRSNKEN